jgi:dCMP deaminase
VERSQKYMEIARKVSEFSTCLRSHFGAIIVKNDIILGIGYNGPARGVAHCSVCRRAGLPSGEGYEKCVAVHAEANAIINSGGRERCLGATLYLASHNRPFDGTAAYNDFTPNFPCNGCGRLIINAGISHVILEDAEKGYVYYDITELVDAGQLV